MSKYISVRIVGFEVVGENAVEMTYAIQGVEKRIKRVTNLDEARRKNMRVGKYLQLIIPDKEYEELFGKPKSLERRRMWCHNTNCDSSMVLIDKTVEEPACSICGEPLYLYMAPIVIDKECDQTAE